MFIRRDDEEILAPALRQPIAPSLEQSLVCFKILLGKAAVAKAIVQHVARSEVQPSIASFEDFLFARAKELMFIMVVGANQTTPEAKMIVEPGGESAQEIPRLSQAAEVRERCRPALLVGNRSVVQVKRPIQGGEANEHGKQRGN